MQDIMQSSELKKPWHSYPLVWMMISIPLSAVIMGVVMIWLAVDTDDGLVADDYYKQGMAINDVIILDTRAAELKLNATIEFKPSDKVIRLKFDKGLLERYPDKLRLKFQHATRANSDIEVIMSHGLDDQYIGHLDKVISEGVWYFEVDNKGMAADEWKLNTRSYVHSDNVINLLSE
jgi:uncharacterized protein